MKRTRTDWPTVGLTVLLITFIGFMWLAAGCGGADAAAPPQAPSPPQAPELPVSIQPAAGEGTGRARGGETVPTSPPPVVPPAPTTTRYQWWDANGNTWFTDEPCPPRIMPAAPAPVVPVQVPFAQSPACPAGEATILTTNAMPAVGRSIRSAVPVRGRGLIRIGVGTAGIHGSTSGCSASG